MKKKNVYVSLKHAGMHHDYFAGLLKEVHLLRNPYPVVPHAAQVWLTLQFMPIDRVLVAWMNRLPEEKRVLFMCEYKGNRVQEVAGHQHVLVYEPDFNLITITLKDPVFKDRNYKKFVAKGVRYVVERNCHTRERNHPILTITHGVQPYSQAVERMHHVFARHASTQSCGGER